MRKAFLILTALALLAAPTLAQAKTSLNIVCNEAGAQVILNGKLVGYTSPNFSFLVAPGKWTVLVKKTGFQDWLQTIDVKSTPITLTVTLLKPGATLPPPTTTPPPAPTSYSISVQSNVANAEVYINGILAGRTPFIGNVASGSYTVVVRAPGYADYTENVRVDGNKLVTANLAATTFQLSVNANVAGAQVLLNGAAAGTVPYAVALPAGTYTVVVRAPNHVDYTETVALSAPRAVNATLTPMLYPFSLKSLVPGAEIFLDGIKLGAANAAGEFLAQVKPGRYTLTVKAFGFFDFTTVIDIGSAVTLPVALKPSMAEFEFSVAAASINPDLKGNPWSQLRVYIDGAAQKDFKGTVAPGKHTVTMISGAFKLETIIEFEAGKKYVLEPLLMLTVKP